MNNVPIIISLLFIVTTMLTVWLFYKASDNSIPALICILSCMLIQILCLGLLLNILVIAILSAQTPFQKFAFDQPNIGVTFFPFIWLPGIVVPIVLISHLAAIRQLIENRKDKYLTQRIPF